MVSKMWFLAFGLALASPALALPTDSAAVRNFGNQDVLQKLYPPRALAAREQGAVGFVVKLDSDGHPTECRVTQSSGFPLLDQETCQVITLHAIFKPPAAVSGSAVSTHQGVINWTLPGAGTAVASRAKKSDVPEKMVCRRVALSGSNVAKERVCASRRDWDKATDEARANWEELQGRKGMTNGN